MHAFLAIWCSRSRLRTTVDRPWFVPVILAKKKKRQSRGNNLCNSDQDIAERIFRNMMAEIWYNSDQKMPKRIAQKMLMAEISYKSHDDAGSTDFSTLLSNYTTQQFLRLKHPGQLSIGRGQEFVVIVGGSGLPGVLECPGFVPYKLRLSRMSRYCYKSPGLKLLNQYRYDTIKWLFYCRINT